VLARPPVSADGICRETNMDTTTLLIIIVLIVLLGGGGWYGRGRWF
jgi:LPXTG-motif cell wall-anchored protein